MKKSLIACGLVIGIALTAQATCGAAADASPRDDGFRTYPGVLKRHPSAARVQYLALKGDRGLQGFLRGSTTVSRPCI